MSPIYLGPKNQSTQSIIHIIKLNKKIIQFDLGPIWPATVYSTVHRRSCHGLTTPFTSTIGSEKFQRILFWRNIFKSWPREKETTSPQIYSYMVKYLIKFVVNRRWEKLYLFLHLMLKNSWKSDKEWLQENVLKINGFIWNI